MVDPGRSPGNPGPSLFLDQNEARRAEKNSFKTAPLSEGLDDLPQIPPPAQSLSEGRDPPLRLDK